MTIKEAIRATGLSYRQLAEQVGISKTCFSDFVNHGAVPKIGIDAIITALQPFFGQVGYDLATFCATLTGPASGPNAAKTINVWRIKMITRQMQEKLGLTKDPFNNEMESLADVLDIPSQRAILDKMLDAAAHQKFVGVYGPVGSGKSVIKKTFIAQLEDERGYLIAEPLLIEKDRCTPSTLCDAIIEDFMYARGGVSNLGKVRSPNKLEEKNRWVRMLLQQNKRQGKTCVLVIDEAHDLPIATLKALKRLYEHEDGFRKMLGIILVGQEELFNALGGDPRVREVTARIDLTAVQPIPQLIKGYTDAKIERAGGDPARVFSSEAYDNMARLLRATNHPVTPIALNVFASNVIVKAYQLDTFPATAEIVEEAFKEMRPTHRRES